MAVTVNSTADYIADQFSQLWRVTDTEYDPAEIADGDEVARDITVTGVALGDLILGVSLSIDAADLVVNAAVTAANTVTLVLANNTGGAVNLGSLNIKILVGRPVW
jgi:hypothetical protein